MLKRIRREISFILSNFSVIVLFSFLTSLGGVLLWVNGGSTWFIMQSYKFENIKISLTGAFVLSLSLYALMGAVMGVILKSNTCGCGGKNKSVVAFSVTMAMYILSLAWYAVFFCTRLSLFSAVLLTIVLILGSVLFFAVRKTMILLSLLVVSVELCEIYFLYVNISFYLLN